MVSSDVRRTVSEFKTEIMGLWAKDMEEVTFGVSLPRHGQIYRRRRNFVYLGKTIKTDGKYRDLVVELVSCGQKTWA